MRSFNFSLFVLTCGYWLNYNLRSLEVGFGLTIAALAIPTILYYFSSYANAKQQPKHPREPRA